MKITHTHINPPPFTPREFTFDFPDSEEARKNLHFMRSDVSRKLLGELFNDLYSALEDIVYGKHGGSFTVLVESEKEAVTLAHYFNHLDAGCGRISQIIKNAYRDEIKICLTGDPHSNELVNGVTYGEFYFK